MALARLGRAERGEVRAHAVSYAGGVLVAFGLLAAVTLALRAAGAAAGWGFQFQSPAFVAAMAWVLFGIGLNLSGVFALGGGGAGQALAGRGGHLGSFFTGLLAVVVATPCTAPFMAAALAAGLVAPPAVMVAVFLAMGAGLAAPWLLLAAVPGLARSLPRPGAWMELLRQALAFPMYAACAWLVWVISEETGPGGVLGTVAGLVLLGFAGWALGAGQRMAMQEVAAPAASLRSWHRTAQAAAVAAVLAAMAVLPGIAGATPGGSRLPDIAGLPSEPYSPTRLAALRAEGRPVFVDMTAAWCVTCLVNERVALGPKSVRDAFAADHVAYLKGDWTRQDPDITAFLRANHRDGVPLYLLYPATGTPIVLPQILTERTMLSALARGS
jgi:thiol:disulfide interchange protein DsbD